MIAVQTEWFDGLEFEKPTWDKTSVSWNPSGSWAHDEAVTARVLDGIRAAVPNHEALAAAALAAVVPEFASPYCPTFWGSHGCSLTAGHDGLCVCASRDEDGQPDVCSAGLKYGEADTFLLWWGDETDLRLSCHHWTWFA